MAIRITDLKEKDRGRLVEYTNYLRKDDTYFYVVFALSSDPDEGTPCKGINLNFI